MSLLTTNRKLTTLFLFCLICVPSGFNAEWSFEAFYNFFKTPSAECCDTNWITRNTTGLQKVLKEKLYGQHLVLRAVLKHVKAHVENKHPPKALALSFHGGTGTGKNYVSKIIADHLFKLGMKSRYVHLISAVKEFPHEEVIHFYKDQIKNWIESNVTLCKHSLFIFDEMDKLPAGLIDTVKPYLEYYEQLAGVDYRHSMFLFLSNTAGSDLFKYTYEQWKNGMPRNNITLVDAEAIIIKSSVNTKTQSGLWHSELITDHLITAYLPFLPLEKSHVKECIKDVLIAKGYVLASYRNKISDTLIREVLDELSFFPDEEALFSNTGCKRVADKVDYVM